MPNANYVKGRRKEYKICDIYKQSRHHKWDIVQRTAGSHSPIDIFAVCKAERRIDFIQAKPDNYPETKANQLLRDNAWLNNTFHGKFRLI